MQCQAWHPIYSYPTRLVVGDTRGGALKHPLRAPVQVSKPPKRKRSVAIDIHPVCLWVESWQSLSLEHRELWMSSGSRLGGAWGQNKKEPWPLVLGVDVFHVCESSHAVEVQNTYASEEVSGCHTVAEQDSSQQAKSLAFEKVVPVTEVGNGTYRFAAFTGGTTAKLSFACCDWPEDFTTPFPMEVADCPFCGTEVVYAIRQIPSRPES
eukprot:749161-Amphidinium_carterae.1